MPPTLFVSRFPLYASCRSPLPAHFSYPTSLPFHSLPSSSYSPHFTLASHSHLTPPRSPPRSLPLRFPSFHPSTSSLYPPCLTPPPTSSIQPLPSCLTPFPIPHIPALPSVSSSALSPFTPIPTLSHLASRPASHLHLIPPCPSSHPLPLALHHAPVRIHIPRPNAQFARIATHPRDTISPPLTHKLVGHIGYS